MFKCDDTTVAVYICVNQSFVLNKNLSYINCPPSHSIKNNQATKNFKTVLNFINLMQTEEMLVKRLLRIAK